MKREEATPEKRKKKGRRTGMFVLLCVGAFLVSFCGSVVFKLNYKSPALQKYSVDWSKEIGMAYTDFAYGEGAANKFDLYVPADQTQETYGLIVYLHAGGFSGGDKSDDAAMLEWLCSLGYVAAGINYTLNSDENPNANVYTMSLEIRDSIPYVIEEAAKLGYIIDRMAISGGSAGGCLALLYAYRDAESAPVPVKMVFEMVGPSSFYPEDWSNYGLDQDSESAAAFFSYMTGKTVTADMIGTPKYDETLKPASALLWIDENTVPSVLAYGKYDTVQPYAASVRLADALEVAGVDHKYFVMEHSGHGLQNDNKEAIAYMEAVLEYLEKYMRK